MNALNTPNRRGFFAALIASVLLGAALLSYLLMATAPQTARKPPTREARLVEVVTLQPSSQQVMVSAYGEVEASQRIALSAQVSGRVIYLSPQFVPGQRIRKGEVLLKIDPADYQVALDNALANLASAEAALAQERGSQAVAQGDFEVLDLQVEPAERALMLREPQLQSAMAMVASAKAAVAQARLNLSRCEVTAAMDVLVVSRNVGVGAQVGGANAVIGEVAAASPFWVPLLVPVDSLRWIELPSNEGPGSAVSLRDVSQPTAAPWTGRVIQLLGSVETAGRRARLLVEVDPTSSPSELPLLLGSYVEAQIAGRRLSQVFQLDPAWLDGDRIWTVREGQLRAVELEVLHRDSGKVLARGALSATEQVVSSLLASAVEGMAVRTAGDERLHQASTAVTAGAPSAAPTGAQP
ncbi:efflux RND transporter periplasmic adaptor subunit [Pseudomarimonas arenosa]|uniref:Efflux RND transporter periplasmic adaptor subunit n=1 Tax=Pseudomarimonas arenosa TaxID=2774145 RepID=A0AAW3ZQ71_9GAMM|nr:efflux RND transporter periplasmic adaptor subunit [Pseudomarimonas arenosa]MBD8527873.1 efflux RND transporter periplasmic adaptor subunit [Pseudomarimonas arenosa]